MHLLLYLLLHLPTQPLVPLLPLRQLLLRQLLAPTVIRPTSIVVALHALLALWVRSVWWTGIARATSAFATASATRTRRYHHRPQLCRLRSRLLYPRNCRLHHQWLHRRPSTWLTGPTRAPRLPRQHPRLRPRRVIFIPIRCSHGYSHCCVPTTVPTEAPTAELPRLYPLVRRHLLPRLCLPAREDGLPRSRLTHMRGSDQ
jgi:hypothetical protein